nr:immunoglobulin heavy chain junction region [Mus musculus]MBK4196621.1 immunoglobulin heavy chain junction region [Mus musculus]
CARGYDYGWFAYW